jgi:hypothetical protein
MGGGAIGISTVHVALLLSVERLPSTTLIVRVDVNIMKYHKDNMDASSFNWFGAYLAKQS